MSTVVEKRNNKSKILIVDRIKELKDLKSCLMFDNYLVESAEDSLSAIDTFSEGSFDLVIIDIDLESMDGIDIFKRVKEADEDISIMIVTNPIKNCLPALEISKYGPFDIIFKPADCLRMRPKVENSIERTRIIRERISDIRRLENMVDDRTRELKAKDSKFDNVLEQMTYALASAIEAKDFYTVGHSKRVAELSKKIGEELNLHKSDLNRLHMAGLLHDIGKIGVPDRVLLKQGKLNNEEFNIMKTHPSKSADIISQIDDMTDIALTVRSHHEKWDGTGYPLGLAAEEIPLGARIMAIADAFDAMTSTRPYRKGLSIKTAKEELIRCSGSAFAPDVLEAFVRIIDRNDIFILSTWGNALD